MDKEFNQKLADFFGVQDWLSAVFVWLSFLLCLANIILILVFVIPHWGSLNFLRLHYTVDLGIDWVADWRWVFVFPGLSAVILGLNGGLAGYLSRRRRRLGLMMLGLTLMMESLIIVASIIVVFLNE